MCTMLVYAHVFVYCCQDNDVMLTSDNRASRLMGPNGACPDVTRLSGIYCIQINQEISAAHKQARYDVTIMLLTL